MHYRIKPSVLTGNITIPPSKSHTLRAILFASLAKGKSIIRNYLPSPDTRAMIDACQLLGAKITVDDYQLTIIGTHGKPKTPDNIIDAGNSGQVLRFIAAVASLTSGYTVITGDHSVRTNRPIQPLLEGLAHLNVLAVSAKGDGSAPIIIKGPLQGGTAILNGEDSQPVSGLLIASAFSEKLTTINVKNPGEKPWIDLTLDWFKRLGIDYQQQDYTKYIIPGNTIYSGFEYTVPGDFSSCAFPLVAALITKSEITLNNLDMHDVQGDKNLIFTLQEMGASIKINHDKKILCVKKSPDLLGKKINANNYIDAAPILAVMGCFTQGETIINGASIARKKESDRLSAITQELKKMGANITELEDGLIIQPAKLKGSIVSSFNDHRIAMSLSIAALSANGETIIENTACIEKSYPNFPQALQQLGAFIEVFQ
jgi:3-phosphoshikimate 1-carboxyvinyltransferase